SSEEILSIINIIWNYASATEEQTSVSTMVVDNVTSMHRSFEDTMQARSEVRDVSKNLHYLAANRLDATAKLKVE
ncbi:chemotaxis protein, partial [Pseudoalteromonas ruthenica]